MGNLTRGQVVFWVIFASALVVLTAVVMSYPVQRPVGRAGAFYPDAGVLCPPGFQLKEDGTCKLIPTFGDELKDQLCKSKGTVYCSLLGRCVLSNNDCKCGGGDFYNPRTKKCVPGWLVSIIGGSGLAYIPPDYGDNFPPGGLPGGWFIGGGPGSSFASGGQYKPQPQKPSQPPQPPQSPQSPIFYRDVPKDCFEIEGQIYCADKVIDDSRKDSGGTCPPPGKKLVPENYVCSPPGNGFGDEDRCQTDVDCKPGDACLKDCDGKNECRPKGSVLACPAPV